MWVCTELSLPACSDFEAVAWAADEATQLICSQMDDKEQCEQASAASAACMA